MDTYDSYKDAELKQQEQTAKTLQIIGGSIAAFLFVVFFFSSPTGEKLLINSKVSLGISSAENLVRLAKICKSTGDTDCAIESLESIQQPTIEQLNTLALLYHDVKVQSKHINKRNPTAVRGLVRMYLAKGKKRTAIRAMNRYGKHLGNRTFIEEWRALKSL